ncbi:RNA polymerase sigma factor [Algiphilus sp.]|uniref:RNA polymerase sigma factor n=1 Tax=Algiphilus sp. TaxID=1872431 RepID=UPI003BACBF27
MASREEFDWMLAAEIPHLRRYARTLAAHPAEADDLVQDCLERAMRKWRLWRGTARLRSWLFRMLHRLYLNRRRDGRHHDATVPLEVVAEPTASGNAGPAQLEVRDTMRALQTLPVAQREAIVLLAIDDLSYEEAAWVLEIPVGTLRSRLSRGREQLRALGESAAPVSEAEAPNLRRVK